MVPTTAAVPGAVAVPVAAPIPTGETNKPSAKQNQSSPSFRGDKLSSFNAPESRNKATDINIIATIIMDASDTLRFHSFSLLRQQPWSSDTFSGFGSPGNIYWVKFVQSTTGLKNLGVQLHICNNQHPAFDSSNSNPSTAVKAYLNPWLKFLKSGRFV